MSGVEAAGFILAAIPLVISFVEHYAEGVRTINRWRKYDRELKSLCRRLRSEEELFRNTCELLLRDIVSSEQELETLVSNPAGLEWSDPDLERSLQKKLPARSYAVYREVVEDMRDIVDAIKDRMGIEDDGTVSAMQERGHGDGGTDEKKTENSGRIFVIFPEKQICHDSKGLRRPYGQVETQQRHPRPTCQPKQ